MADITDATVAQIIENAKLALNPPYDFGANATVYKNALAALITRMDHEIIRLIFRAEAPRPPLEPLSADPLNLGHATTIANIKNMHAVRKALMDAYNRGHELDPAS